MREHMLELLDAKSAKEYIQKYIPITAEELEDYLLDSESLLAPTIEAYRIDLVRGVKSVFNKESCKVFVKSLLLSINSRAFGQAIPLELKTHQAIARVWERRVDYIRSLYRRTLNPMTSEALTAYQRRKAMNSRRRTVSCYSSSEDAVC